MNKRRDNRGRPLEKGESQRKDGRYTYKYTDNAGKEKFVYSWKLVNSDKVPSGRKDDIALRDKIKQINKDLEDGISFADGEMSLIDLMKKYFSRKRQITYSTHRSYENTLCVVGKSKIGKKKIKTIKPIHLEDWFLELYDSNKSYSTIKNIHCYVKASLNFAVDNEFIRKNPCNFPLSSILIDTTKEKPALTQEQEDLFLEFIKTTPRFSAYYNAIVVLFDTGLRISELAGLTKADVDFINEEISINHQLQKKNGAELFIGTLKTKGSVREIPMSKRVTEALKNELSVRKTKIEPVVDGKGGFIFLTKDGKPTYAKIWEERFRRICKEYNNTHEIKLPKITPHICRHTCCTKMLRKGMSDLSTQQFLGHTDIRTTKQYYADFDKNDVKQEFRAIMMQ